MAYRLAKAQLIGPTELTNSRYIGLLYYAGSSGTELKQCPRSTRVIIHISKSPSGLVAPSSGLGRPVSINATARHEDAGDEL